MKRVFLLSILFAVLFTSCNMGMLGQYSDYYYYSPNKNTGGKTLLLKVNGISRIINLTVQNLKHGF